MTDGTETPKEVHTPTAPDDRLLIYVDLVKAAEVLCRSETKETLVLAAASDIAWKAVSLMGVQEITSEEVIASEMSRIREWRGTALSNVQHRRFESTIERIRAGTYKPPRRRKRRKAKRKVAS